MLKVTARAKINWSLDILGTLESGYHRMDMLMSTVALADELFFSPAETISLTVSGNPVLSAQDNIVAKAAEALKTHSSTAQGAHIALIKHIPHGAGMGGGSADAAAALLALNQLWELHLSMDTLHAIAQDLGADVPFFLTGGFARVGGFGEEIHPLPPLPDIPLVILQPCKPQSTKEVFELYDTCANLSHPDTDVAQAALLHGDFDVLQKSAGNVLAQALAGKLPQIAEAIAALDACGALFASMTGSGSAVFGAFASADEAADAHHSLRKRWKKCWVSQTSDQSITMEEV